jgi:hypothetical protein
LKQTGNSAVGAGIDSSKEFPKDPLSVMYLQTRSIMGVHSRRSVILVDTESVRSSLSLSDADDKTLLTRPGWTGIMGVFRFIFRSNFSMLTLTLTLIPRENFQPSMQNCANPASPTAFIRSHKPRLSIPAISVDVCLSAPASQSVSQSRIYSVRHLHIRPTANVK